jgi:hypothetical protein
MDPSNRLLQIWNSIKSGQLLITFGNDPERELRDIEKYCNFVKALISLGTDPESARLFKIIPVTLPSSSHSMPLQPLEHAPETAPFQGTAMEADCRIGHRVRIAVIAPCSPVVRAFADMSSSRETTSSARKVCKRII